jgi:hypothetical protein
MAGVTDCPKQHTTVRVVARVPSLLDRQRIERDALPLEVASVFCTRSARHGPGILLEETGERATAFDVPEGSPGV